MRRRLKQILAAGMLLGVAALSTNVFDIASNARSNQAWDGQTLVDSIDDRCWVTGAQVLDCNVEIEACRILGAVFVEIEKQSDGSYAVTCLTPYEDPIKTA